MSNHYSRHFVSILRRIKRNELIINKIMINKNDEKNVDGYIPPRASYDTKVGGITIA